MVGTTKTLNYQALRNRLHAGLKCISHKSSRLLAVRNLANSAYYCHYRYHHRDRSAYLEA